MSSLTTERLARVFVEVADTLVDEFDLIEFLQLVTARAADLAGSSEAGLLLADEHHRLHFMAASNEQARLVELFQVQANEGPCHDCFLTGTAVVNSNLQAASGKWPRFAPAAVEAGFLSVHAFPLRLRGDTIGALNLFGDSSGNLGADDAVVIQALADVATIGLLQERAVHRSDHLVGQLQGALNSRIVIEQAKGALAQIHGISVDDAFDRLRTYARSRQMLLGLVARAVVADPASVDGLTRPD